MSYDISIYVKVDGIDKYAEVATPEYSSPTYNLGKLFRACMDWDYSQVSADSDSTLIEYLRAFGVVNNEIKIKYFDPDLTKIEKISKGDWIDLRSAETLDLKQGEYRLIRLGVGMILPDGYEAIVAPRSSTPSKIGVLMSNSIGVIDSSYSGDADEWKFPAYAIRDTHIEKNDRICQFRIIKNMDPVDIVEVDHLREVSRGGIGSTGRK